MKKLLLGIIFFILLFFFYPPLLAQENSSDNGKKDIENKIKEYEQKLSGIRQQKNTLSSQIQYMDTQIYLTALRIQDTERKFNETQKEIETLTTRIEGLDNSLNYLSKLLIEKVSESYKKRSLSFLSILLDSNSAEEFLNQSKYLKTTRENNQKLLVQVQETKLNFEEQKKLREEKKKQLEELRITLANQKINLNTQKIAKQKLLNDTQNDENLYQQRLAEAQAQLSAFKSFVVSSGENTTIPANGLGTGSDGTYYSQRDQRWAYKSIGYSSENILEVGCLITSLSMFAKKNGQNITPLDMANDFDRFYGLTAYTRLPWKDVAGKKYQSLSKSQINSELDNGNPVIVGVYKNSCSYGGNHFVLLTKREGNDYIMHDPIYGPDKKFNSYYSTICSAATFK